MVVIRGYKSRRPEVFYKKGALRNFAELTRKHLFWSLSFNKIAGLRSATPLKKESNIGVFLCKAAGLFKYV